MKDSKKTKDENIRSKVIGSRTDKKDNLIHIITLGSTIEVSGVNYHKNLMDRLKEEQNIIIYKAGKEIVKLRIYSTKRKYIEIETK